MSTIERLAEKNGGVWGGSMKDHMTVLARILKETQQLVDLENCEVSKREVAALEWAIAALEAAAALAQGEEWK